MMISQRSKLSKLALIPLEGTVTPKKWDELGNLKSNDQLKLYLSKPMWYIYLDVHYGSAKCLLSVT
jgi:hypothetical protein